MDYIRAMERSVGYMEENLREELDLDGIAAASGFSKFHFCRIFKALTHNTVDDYVRRRRLTFAARDLVDTGQGIMDIALTYGYQSQEAFTRAFKNYYQTTPMAYRKAGTHWGNNDKMMLSLQVMEMKQNLEKWVLPHRIEELPSMCLMGFPFPRCHVHNKGFAWDCLDRNEHRMTERLYMNRYYGLRMMEENIGLSDAVWYMPSLEVPPETETKDGTAVRHVPANRYAVFAIPSVPEYLHRAIMGIYGRALPEAGLAPVDEYDFEYFDEEYRHNDPSGRLYLYVPVK